MRKNEKEKLRWKKLKKYFGKIPPYSISAVEYQEDGCLIRTSS